MITPGLVSITFRPLSPREIVDLCVRTGLRSVEWGGDVHVPPINSAHARDVARLTTDAGLTVAAYGSYFRIIDGDGSLPDFEPIVATAADLGAPTIRVWAGTKNSEEVNGTAFDTLVERLQSMATLATTANIRVALEFHGGTFTNTTQSTLDLLDAVNHPNLETLWQPPVGMSAKDCAKSLEACLPRTNNVHVFHWTPMHERQPLAEGTDRWKTYLDMLAKSSQDRHLLLEFVKGDSVDQLRADAETLLSLVS